MTARALSEYEAATINPCRSRSWRWLRLDEIRAEAQRYHRTPRRVVRHHLARFTTLGLLAHTTGLAYLPGDFWRWSPNAPTEHVAALEAAADAAHLLLEPVVAAPVTCPNGHPYKYAEPDGGLLCEDGDCPHGHVVISGPR